MAVPRLEEAIVGKSGPESLPTISESIQEFPASVTRPLHETDSEQEQEELPWQGQDRGNWGTVYYGVALILAAVILVLCFWALIIASVVLGTFLEGWTRFQAAKAVLLGADALAIAGFALCVRVPDRHGARSLAWTSLALCGMTFVLSNLAFVLGWWLEQRSYLASEHRVGEFLQLVFISASQAQFVVFLHFFRTIAICLGKHRLANHVNVWLKLGIIVIVPLVVLPFMTGMTAGLFLAMATLIVSIVFFVLYVVILHEVLQAISHACRAE
jgi:hypothetical protein